MFNILKKNKIVFIILITDLFLYWLVYYSGIVLPFINPSIEEYELLATSFPRDTHQLYFWILLRVPIALFMFGYVLKHLFVHKKLSATLLALPILYSISCIIYLYVSFG